MKRGLPTSKSLLLASAALAGLAGISFAQPAQGPSPLPPAIPAPQDVVYPGTIKLAIDATDLTHGISACMKRSRRSMPAMSYFCIRRLPDTITRRRQAPGRSSAAPSASGIQRPCDLDFLNLRGTGMDPLNAGGGVHARDQEQATNQ